MSDDRFELVISPTARRQLTDKLPESVAFAAYEFIIDPQLENPHRAGKRLRPPLDDLVGVGEGAAEEPCDEG